MTTHPDRIEAAARECVEELFTSGGTKANRLVLWRDGASPNDLGGWGRGPVVARIAALVRREAEREREECEKIAIEALADERKALNAGGYIEACMELAAAIRARGGKAHA